MISTNEFRNGSHIEIDGKIFRIIEFQHVKPGKGGAFVRTKLRRIDDGSVQETHGRLVDHARRVLTADDVLAVVQRQVDDRRSTIAEIAAHDGPTADLSAEIDVLERYLA